MNRNEQGFGVLIGPLADGKIPGEEILPELLAIAKAENASLLGYPLPEIHGKKRTVAPYLFPVVNDAGERSAWAFFVGEGHVAGRVDPTSLPTNQMTVAEVMKWSQR